jgi:hypothetical protein
MDFNRGALRTFSIWILAAFPLLLAAQPSGTQDAEPLKSADAAFHAGYAALQAGNLEQASASCPADS